MPRDDRLKKVQGVGADFLETARARAEEFLRELSRASGDTSERAQGALDELVTGGRKSTEQFVATIRKEIQTQLGALGLATKADLEALERRLSSRSTGTASGRASRSTATRSATTKSTATKATATKSTAPRATAKKAAGSSRSTAAKKSSPAKKAAPARKTTKKTAG